MVFLAKIVLVEQSAAEARNADKNAAWICFLSLCRLKWFIDSSAFQLGSGAWTVRNRFGMA